ncbi:MAG: peptidylprolyl isomerase [Kiritimatiellaeota bacterium]|nr:peptidylprolyl isomerase [Kiritimatiellota bacterium]
MLVGRNPNLPEAQLKKAAHGLTSQLIDRELLLGICKKAGIQPDLKKAAKRLSQLEKRFGGPQGLDRILAFQGLTRDEVARQIAEEVALSEWVDKKIRPHIKIDEAALKEYYSTHKSQFETPEKMQASHILIKVKPDASPDEKVKARKKAETVLAKLKKGADFAELARKDSDGPSSRNGGDLGSFQRGQMVPAFDKAAFALKEGQLSDIVETRFGYHIIKAGKHTPARMKTFKESDAEIRNKLQKKELIARVERVLKAARAAAKVEILVPEK